MSDLTVSSHSFDSLLSGGHENFETLPIVKLTLFAVLLVLDIGYSVLVPVLSPVDVGAS